MDKKRFQRRIYTVRSFIEATDDVLTHLPDLRAARRAGRVDHAFAERIMIAVTKVNGCRYCDYGHTRAALAAGVTRDQLDALEAGEFNRLPEEERTALIFAQHYAHTGGHPDDEAWAQLVDAYGEHGARDVMAYIRMITMGNLLGNTFDALLYRLIGRGAPYSTLWDEFAVIAGFPLILTGRMIRARRS